MMNYWMMFSKTGKYLVGILFLGFITSCAPLLLHSDAVYMKPDPVMINYFNEFEQATETHNWDKVMQMIHPNYVKEQHDNFLEGRTDQFLNEFFGMPRDEIKRLDFIVSYFWLNNQWVDFWVVKSDGTKNRASWSILDRKDDSGYKIGLVGAVG
ncbi:MAG: hypothetical protein R2780_09515 [Crocinitomicaceae bacterium]|nr:hypothetical protein [Crocinitomicaceae bacterium]